MTSKRFSSDNQLETLLFFWGVETCLSFIYLTVPSFVEHKFYLANWVFQFDTASHSKERNYDESFSRWSKLNEVFQHVLKLNSLHLMCFSQLIKLANRKRSMTWSLSNQPHLKREPSIVLTLEINTKRSVRNFAFFSNLNVRKFKYMAIKLLNYIKLYQFFITNNI